MRKGTLFFLIFAIFLPVAVVVNSFCKKEDTESQVKALIEDGKKQIGNGDFVTASQIFSKAVEKSPENPQARFGLALSLIGLLAKNVEKVVLELGGIITQFLGLSPIYRNGKIYTMQDSVTEGVTLNDILEDIISSNLIEPMDRIIENLKIPAEKDGWNLYVEKLTWVIKFEDKVLWEIDMSGEFDSADANFLYSVFNLLEGVFKLLLSINIHLTFENLVRIYSFISSIGGLTAIGGNPRIVILNILPFILNENENFLGVEPKRGVKYWTVAVPRNFIESARAMSRTYELLLKETDDQIDDVISVVEKSEDGKNIRKIAFPTSSTYFIDSELTTKYGEKRKLASIEVPTNFLDIFNSIRESFEGTRRVKWGSLVDSVSFFLVAILKTGIFDSIISALLGSAGSLGVPETALQQVFAVIDPQLISGIIKSAIPDVIEFDFKQFFSKPIGIRNILPAWTSENSILIEWECFSDSPKIIPLSEGNIAFIFLCKMPKNQYCFAESKEKICDIRVVKCYESLIRTEESGCSLFCPVSPVQENEQCKEKQEKRSICLNFDEKGERCMKFCAETRIRKLVDGNEDQTCSVSIRFEDREHFVDFKNPGKGVIPPISIPKDGMNTIIPYLGLQSPDFYGLIYIDYNFLKSYDINISKSGYQKPDQYGINLLIQIIGKNIERLLGQFGII